MEQSHKPRKTPTAISRMKQDYMRLKRDPLPYVTAEPLPSNMLEWHYVVKGPEDSPYQGGYYHGKLLFPREFPFKPPSICMLTPNGRFETNVRLCLSNSDYHPDTWNPTWCVGTILTGLLSFMLESTPTTGSIKTSVQEKRALAQKSLAFNLKNQQFRELFPDICEEITQRLKGLQKNAQLTANGVDCDQKSKGTANGGTIFENNNNVNNDEQPQMGERSASGKHVKKFNINWHSVCTNAIVGLSFSIFVLIVNYVLKNLTHD